MKMLIIAKGYFHRDIFTSEYFHKHADLIDFFHKLHLLLLIIRQQCFRSLKHTMDPCLFENYFTFYFYVYASFV